LHKTAAAVGIFVNIHVSSLGLFQTPCRHDWNIVIGLKFSAAEPLDRRSPVAKIWGAKRRGKGVKRG
jgi:hypothetical protein